MTVTQEMKARAVIEAAETQLMDLDGSIWPNEEAKKDAARDVVALFELARELWHQIGDSERVEQARKGAAYTIQKCRLG